jgi:hypothetical protein
VALHVLVDTVEERQQRVIWVYFFLIVALGLVEPEFDVGDLARNGIDGCERPAVEIGHRLRGIYALGSGRLVDRERVVTEGFGLLVYVGNFSFERAATVADDDGAVTLEALKAIDRSRFFLAKSATEFVADRAEEARHKGALSVAPASITIEKTMGILTPTMLNHLIFAALAVLMTVEARAAPPMPNDCWSGVMAADKAAHGRLVATGPVTQWRVGTPLVVYSTIEDYAQIEILMSQGKTGTFDTAHPITVIPTWISGPEPGDKNNRDEEKNIEVFLKYRTAEGETGIATLTYWTPMGVKYTSLPRDQQEFMIEQHQLMHDMSCRGIP